MDIQERIISEAGLLFSKYGIRSITMDSLAEDLGISKRTIYENFKDKDALLLEVINNFKNQQHEISINIIENSENIIVAFFKLLNNTVNLMKQVNPLFFQDIKKYHSHIFEKVQDKGELRDRSMTGMILKQGLSQKIFRTDLNIEIVNLTLHELFNLFSPDSKLTQAGFHRGELFNNIIIPYLIGISTEKGRNLILSQGPLKY